MWDAVDTLPGTSTPVARTWTATRPVAESTVIAPKPVAAVVTAGTSWLPSIFTNTTRTFDGFNCVRISPPGNTAECTLKYVVPARKAASCAGVTTAVARVADVAAGNGVAVASLVGAQVELMNVTVAVVAKVGTVAVVCGLVPVR